MLREEGEPPAADRQTNRKSVSQIDSRRGLLVCGYWYWCKCNMESGVVGYGHAINQSTNDPRTYLFSVPIATEH